MSNKTPFFAVVMEKQGYEYESIYEVGRQGGEILQRKINIKNGKPRKWRKSGDWHDVWNK